MVFKLNAAHFSLYATPMISPRDSSTKKKVYVNLSNFDFDQIDILSLFGP